MVITGGDIELDKSSVNVMTWGRKKGEEILLKDPPIKKLVLNSVKLPGYSEPVEKLETCHGERLLGVRLAMDGNDNDEFKFWLEQSKTLANKIRISPFTRLDSEVIYRER